MDLVPRARPLVIGLLGGADAGKTTMLAIIYQHLLLQGRTLADAAFAGSRSLGGWESIAHSLRFTDPVSGAAFPPHTSRGSGRVPGLLHVALRRADGEFRDILLADTPGEWFTTWSTNQDAEDARGARWVAQHADAFLVLADCQRLASNSSARGQARREARQIIERLADVVGRRPVRLVWAKHDHVPPAAITQPIVATLMGRIPQADQGSCRHDQPDTVAEVFHGIIRKAWAPAFARPCETPITNHDPFLAYRGDHAYP